MGRDIARVVGARTRAKGYLQGPDVRVSWCIGHLAALCEPHEYDPAWKRWSLDLLPIIPVSFKVRRTSNGAGQFQVLRQLMNDPAVTSIVNACDAGREGELIFRRVYELAGCKKPVTRLWISSLTDEAIRHGMAHLRPSATFDDLADAARSRAEADWLVGMNATRAMTALGRRGGNRDILMSVGRVQTPTLAMIARRERDIEQFEKQPYWQVHATFSWLDAHAAPNAARPIPYTGLWHQDKQDRLDDEARANAIAQAVAGRSGLVVRVQQKTVRERPPLLFDLTTLQKLANRRFGMSAKRTLTAAQTLYEKHKAITYPRTDSRYLTSDMVEHLPPVLESLQREPYGPFAAQALARGVPRGKRMINDAEVGDHHAIIPTTRIPGEQRLGRDETRVYDLIARRFLAGFLPDAVFDKTRIETEVAGHRFVSDGRVCRERGYQAVEPPARAKRDKRDKPAASSAPDGQHEQRRPSRASQHTEDKPLPPVREGDRVDTDAVEVRQCETKPPKRYTEATLLSAMEHAGKDVEEKALRRALKDAGLGTPATRAAIIETLLKREYIERQGRSLHPTARGRALIDAIPVPVLLSAEMTGAWEQRLSQMARGQLGRIPFMDDICTFTRDIVASIAGATPPLLETIPKTVLGNCPVCRTPVTEGRRAFHCETGKPCSFVIFKRIAGRQTSAALVRVLLRHGRSQVLQGFRSKRGKRFSAALVLSPEGKVEFSFDNHGDSARPNRAPKRKTSDSRAQPPATTTTAQRRKQPARGPRCPACRQGHIIAGRRGWGCSRWREACSFVVWFEHRGTRIPDDEAERLFRRGQTRLMSGLSQAGKARLILDLNAAGNVRVQLSKRAQKTSE